MTDDLDRIAEAYRRYEDEGRSRLWTLDNPGYRRLAIERTAALVELISISAPHQRATVLDVGCGDGALANDVRRAMPLVHWMGVDLRASAIESARRVVPWATFVQASADELPLNDGAFDIVVNSVFMSSIPSRSMRQAVSRELGRVLRPGGWLVWYDLRYDNPGNRSVHGIGRAEVAELFPGWHIQLHTVTLLPPVARRLGALTPLLYPALHAIPLLRSHLIGRLRCPAPPS